MNRRSFFGLTLGGILAALCPWKREPRVGNHAHKMLIDDVVSKRNYRIPELKMHNSALRRNFYAKALEDMERDNT